jgi:hypothetical protein
VVTRRPVLRGGLDVEVLVVGRPLGRRHGCRKRGRG